MQPDDDLCLCFHVSWRKVINFIRIHRVRVPSRLSECQGAGTGCGWCRVFMEQLVQRIGENEPLADDMDAWLEQQMPAAQAYTRRRADYIARGKVRTEADYPTSPSDPITDGDAAGDKAT